jgi:hypothetical protein
VAAAAVTTLGAAAPPALAITATAQPPGAIEGVGFTGTVATFTDGISGLLGCTPAGQYSATVTWGDGTTSAASVSGGVGILIGGCLYAVAGSHTYAEEGTVTYSVALTGPGTTGTTGPAGLLVTDGPLSAMAAPFNASQGTPAAATIATFTDANHAAPAADFTATVAFGDGTSGVGSVTPGPTPGAGYAVTATHTYPHTGSYVVATTIKDVGGAEARTTTTATVLTTSNSPAKPPPGTPPARLKLGLSRPALARGGTVVVAVRCPVAAKLCRGRLSVATVAVPGSRFPILRRAQVLGATLFIIPGGRRAELSVRPKRALVAQLRSVGTVAVAGYASSFDAATGRSQVTSLTARLKLG